MRLATLRDGSPDGSLVVVSRDGRLGIDARAAAGSLRAALDDWQRTLPSLARLEAELDNVRFEVPEELPATTVSESVLEGFEDRCLGDAFSLTLPWGSYVYPEPAVVRKLGGRVAANVKLAMVVPGSGLVKEQAEREGLDQVFKAAGFEWREPGCSMCLAMNPDKLQPGERCASTSNRNFEGRQGRGGRTHLMSPAMAAAAAVTGRLTDIRELL